MTRRGVQHIAKRLVNHRGPRLLIINNMPAYYRTAPFRALIEQFESDMGGVGYVAYQVRRDTQHRGEWFYTPDSELPFAHSFTSADTRRGARLSQYPLRLSSAVWLHYRPTHIFAAGWDSPLSLVASAFARARPIRLGIWVESSMMTSTRRDMVTNRVRGAVLRSADFSVVPTTASADYVRALAGNGLAIRKLLNPVVWPRIPGRVDSEMKRLIFLGDLSRRKGFDFFCETLAEGAPRGWSGLVWGRDIEGLGARAPENCSVRSAKPLSAILPELRASDILVIPSRVDPAPLVYSEALALGLRVLVSNRIAYGLETDPPRGVMSYDPGQQAKALKAAELLRMSDRPSPEERRHVSPETWARNVCEELVGREGRIGL